MTLLRAKMIREMKLQRMAPRTIEAYVKAVEQLANYYGRTPEKISQEEVRSFLHHLLVDRKNSSSTCNQKICALKFLYRYVLKQEDFELNVSLKRRRRLPEILSCNEVSRLIAAAKNSKHRCLIMLAYGSGLRVSEVTRLKCRDIQSERMAIRITDAKGRKDRYTVLPKRLLQELRVYYQEFQPKTWLFFNARTGGPMSIDTAQKTYYLLKRRAGIERGNGIHTLRHCFASHSLENGASLPTIQQWLGHKHLSTTLTYLHVAAQQPSNFESPLDRLPPPRPVTPLE